MHVVINKVSSEPLLCKKVSLSTNLSVAYICYGPLKPLSSWLGSRLVRNQLFCMLIVFIKHFYKSLCVCLCVRVCTL